MTENRHVGNPIEIVPLNAEREGHEYDSLKQTLPEIEGLSNETATRLTDAICEAIYGGAPMAFAGGYAFERKGYLNVDRIGGPRNPSYSSDNDDLIFQITVRVPRDFTVLEAVEADVAKLREAERKAREFEIDAQIAQLQAAKRAL